MYVNIALSSAWGNSKRSNACDLRGASSLFPFVVQVSGAGWEEVDPVSTQCSEELGRGPELLFPLAMQRTEAEYVLALKTAFLLH